MTAPFRFLSVCSGIEAASVAWEPLGWRAAAFAEIDPFPCAVLAHRQRASRPLHMPQPDALPTGMNPLARALAARRRAAAIKAVADLPEWTQGSRLVPNFGDLEAYRSWPNADVSLLVGGTPCQSFSVAGLRQGLDDPRGNLALVFLGVADRYRPQWVVWENVPGVLSSGKGRDFGSFLGALVELGYGFAYRVLDAQYVRTRLLPGAVPQRRRRVFVVGYLGDWRPAAAVLFDGESLRGNPPPRRRAGQRPAPTLASRPSGGGGLGTDFDIDGGLIPATAHTLRAEGFDASEDGTGRGAPLVPEAVAPCLNSNPYGDHESREGLLVPTAYRTAGDGAVYEEGDCCAPLTTGTDLNTQVIAFSAKDHGADAGPTAPTLRAMGHAASHANAGGQIAIAIQERAVSENPAAGPDGAGFRQDGAAYTLEARTVPQAVAFQDRFRGDDGRGYDRAPPASEEVTGSLETVKPWNVAFDLRGREGGAMPEGPHDTAALRAASGGSSRSYLASPWAVRRLTPRECERLQGFPDDYTDVPYRRRNWTPDGPRYKALGNSMAVNAMQWLGERIAMVEAVLAGRDE
jgi:DNA (cytosine-5)-methyltransferase 1